MQKKFWIPILIVLLAVIGCGLFYNQKTANQEPVTSIKPVEVKRSTTAQKTPPPGETAESGHWHGDVWHAEPHETPVEPPSTAEVNQPILQETPSVIPQGDSTANPNQEPSEASTRTRTPQEVAEIQRQWREWREWEDKYSELGDEHLQAEQEITDMLALTEEERYETDENYRREVGRKISEAMEKSAKVYEKMKSLEETKPPVPPSLR